MLAFVCLRALQFIPSFNYLCSAELFLLPSAVVCTHASTVKMQIIQDQKEGKHFLYLLLSPYCCELLLLGANLQWQPRLPQLFISHNIRKNTNQKYVLRMIIFTTISLSNPVSIFFCVLMSQRKFIIAVIIFICFVLIASNGKLRKQQQVNPLFSSVVTAEKQHFILKSFRVKRRKVL